MPVKKLSITLTIIDNGERYDTYLRANDGSAILATYDAVEQIAIAVGIMVAQLLNVRLPQTKPENLLEEYPN